MEGKNFYAMLARMKYINRWGLMRNTFNENISEHSLEVAIIAHALAVIKNKRFEGNVNAERAALLGVFHDSSEIITGDMPTPIKYHNPEIRDAYKKVENIAERKLLSMLPSDLAGEYEDIFFAPESDTELRKIVKAADKISALIKCVEEEKSGNREFHSAATALKKSIKEMNLPEADCFVTEFLPSYSLTLDELE